MHTPQYSAGGTLLGRYGIEKKTERDQLSGMTKYARRETKKFQTGSFCLLKGTKN